MSAVTQERPAARGRSAAGAGGLALQVPARELLAELRFVSAAIASRAPVPVLAGVLVEATSGGVRLAGFDYATSATALLAAPGAQGRALLPAAHLRRMVSVLGNVDVTIRAEGERCTLTGGGVTFELPTLPVDEYPTLPGGADHLVAVLDAVARRRLLQVLPAVSRDECLPILCAVRLEVHDGQLAALATDRYRLAVADRLAPSMAPQDSDWLVRGARLRHVLRAVAKDRDVAVRVSDLHGASASATTSWLQVDAGNRTLTTQLDGGAYPKVRQLFPEQGVWTATFDRAELLTAVRQVSVAVDGDPVRLEPVAGAAAVRLRAGEQVVGAVGSSATKDVPLVSATGEMTPIAFNPAFLHDAVASVAGEHVTVHGTAPTKPGWFVGSDDPDFRHLLMPVRTAGAVA